MKIKAKITGNKEVQAALDRLWKQNRGAAVKAVMQSVIYVEGRAKDRAPHVLGFLRSSITHTVEDEGTRITGKVGSNLEYAKYVEFPTRPHIAPIHARYAKKYGFPVPPGKNEVFIRVSGRAQPFLYPALWESTGKIKGFFTDGLRRANTK